MKRFRNITLFALLFTSLESLCQSNEKVEMADVLRQDGKIYTVVEMRWRETARLGGSTCSTRLKA